MEKEHRVVRRGCDYGGIIRDATLLGFKMEQEGPGWGEGYVCPLEAGNSREIDFS